MAHIPCCVANGFFAQMCVRRHDRLASLTQGGQNLLGRAAPNPVIVGQIGEAKGTACVGSVAYRTVGGKQTLANTQGLWVFGHFLDRHGRVAGKDRCKLCLGTFNLTLVLAYLGPAKHALPLAQAGVQCQVNTGKNHGADEQHEPPAR